MFNILNFLICSQQYDIKSYFHNFLILAKKKNKRKKEIKTDS